MPPYNIEVVSPSSGRGPSNGNAIVDSLNRRNEFMAPSSSPRRTAAYGNNTKAMRARPQADMPSSSSSGSWAAELFPNSHPRTRQQQQPSYPAAPPSMVSGMGNSIVSASIHPHIRELVERQQERERQKQAYDAQQQLHHQQQKDESPHMHQHQQHQFQHPKLREMYNQNNQDDVNVIRGLHMNHVLNDQQHQEYNDDFVSNHPLSPPLDSPINRGVPPHLSNGQAQLSPRSYHRQQLEPLPVNTVDDDGDYIIEGTFQNKGCVCQTADDVGYLFGCGTKPQDEVVYVYNTKKPKQSEGPPAAQANERNLWYHQGPTASMVGGDENINDLLFQIDKEYQAMQAHHEGNMGLNTHGHSEFLRDPPPGAAGSPRNGPHYRVVQEDDQYTKTSCSMSSLMDLFLPGNRKGKQSRGNSHRALCGSRLSPRKGFFGDYSNYPPDREDRDRRYSTGMLCSSSPRNKRRPRPASMSNSNEDEQSTTSSFDRAFAKFASRKKIVKNASDGVSELQNQLKAMVKERAQNKSSPPESPKETRQEPTPPVSPKVSSSEDDDKEVGKSSSSEKEMDRLRKEKESLNHAREKLKMEMEHHEQKQSLDQARNMLKLELAQHEQKMHEQNMAAHYGMSGVGMGAAGLGVGGLGMVGSPTSMGVAPPMVLSPLPAHSPMATTPMMMANPTVTVPNVTLQPQPMQQMNGMGMTGGMWPQQQLNTGMNTGLSSGIGNGVMGAQQQAQQLLQQTAGHSVAPQSVAPQSVAPQSVAPHSVAPDAPSVMDKSMYSMGQSTMHRSIFSGRGEGKFIDNIGAYPIRPKVSPKGSPLHGRSPRSRPQPTSHHANNGEDHTQSSQMLNDLKVKNELIRQDISRMKNVMGNKNSSRSGGVNVAGGIKKAGQSASRPFPRTSPPSSPSNNARYELQDDPVARAMQRSDEARSIASGSLKGHQGDRPSSCRAQSRGHDRQPQGRYGGGGGGGRQGGYDYSRRQPPSPMRTTRRRDQEYYHV